MAAAHGLLMLEMVAEVKAAGSTKTDNSWKQRCRPESDLLPDVLGFEMS